MSLTSLNNRAKTPQSQGGSWAATRRRLLNSKATTRNLDSCRIVPAMMTGLRLCSKRAVSGGYLMVAIRWPAGGLQGMVGCRRDWTDTFQTPCRMVTARRHRRVSVRHTPGTWTAAVTSWPAIRQFYPPQKTPNLIFSSQPPPCCRTATAQFSMIM